MPLNWYEKARDFLTRDIWRVRMRQLSKTRALGIRLVRVLILSLRGFHDDQCHLRASALTFFTLLSVVPVMALGFGIAKGFGIESNLDVRLRDALEGHQEIYDRIKTFADSMLENTQGGLIAGVGIIILFWTVIKLLSHVEFSFNHIWGIRKQRPWGRRLADYSLVMFLAPVLFVVASSLNVLASQQVQTLVSTDGFLSHFGEVFQGVLKLLPFVAVWTLFTFFYVFMPNTRVRILAGGLAGIVAGTVYQLLQWLYIEFQVGVASYNAVYGSFAALPLFLLWVQLSWLVVLFGAEIAFSWQNAETFELEPDSLRTSRRFKLLLALRTTHLLVKAFLAEQGPLTAQAICHRLELPIRLVNEILFELTAAGIVAETRLDGSEESCYQIGRPVDRLTVSYVVRALAGRGLSRLPVAESSELETLDRCLDQFGEALESSSGNIPLKDI